MMSKPDFIERPVSLVEDQKLTSDVVSQFVRRLRMSASVVRDVNKYYLK